MTQTFDRRLTPARADMAAEHLRGVVEAARFVAGRPMRIGEEMAALRAEPRRDHPVDTQALYGETMIVYAADEEGWAWGQLRNDSYVGYVPSEALREDARRPTHRVRVPRTFVYPAPDVKTPPVMSLPLGAELCIAGARDEFAEIQGLGFVWAGHLAAHDVFEADFVAVAERFLHVAYLWGGKTFAGLDCSGLIQIALAACGVGAPRDTDLMAQAVGEEISIGDDLAGLRRGDLVFWKGHIGVMRDARTLLHANGHHMMVVSEPLRQARDRIREKSFGAITTVRRLA